MLTYMTVTAPQDLRNFVVQTPYSYIPQTSNHFLAPPTVTKSPCKGETPEISSHTIRNIPMLLLRLNCIWFHSPGNVPFLPEDDTSRILAAREDFISFWLASQPPYLIGLNAVAGLQDPTKMLAERAWLRVPLSIRPLIGRDDDSTFVGSIALISNPLR